MMVLYTAMQQEYKLGYKLAFLKENFLFHFMNNYLLSSGTVVNGVK